MDLLISLIVLGFWVSIALFVVNIVFTVGIIAISGIVVVISGVFEAIANILRGE